MATYRYLGVDHSLAAVAARHGSNLDQLWTLNDPGRRFARAQEWAHSVGYTQELRIDYPASVTRYEWDLFDRDEGNISLLEFCDRRNEERRQRRREGRPVGPTLTPELLWYALPNEDFRYQQLVREGRSRGATARDVQNLEDEPQNVYVRPTTALGIFVPMVPVPSSRPAAAAPNGSTRVLVTLPHWIRELLEKREDIEHAAAALRALVARERAVRAEFADTLTTLSRLDEFLRILVEGRSGSGAARTYAAADVATLGSIDGLRRQLFHVQQRVADLGRRKREAVVTPQAREQRSTRLRTLIQDRAFSTLYRRAVLEDARAHGERVAPQVQQTVLDAYRLAVDAAVPWAEQDVEEALSPTQTWWQTTAQWLPLATALFVPMIGNLPGPPSVAVWLAQWRAGKELSRILASLGNNSAEAVNEAVARVVTRYAQGRRLVITLAQYEEWLGRVHTAENMYNAVLHAPTGADAGAAATIRVGQAAASVDDQLLEIDRWMATAREAEARLGAVSRELSSTVSEAEQAAHQSTLALKNRVVAILTNPNLTPEVRRQQLRQAASNNVTGSVQTGNLVTGGLLVLNLLAIASGIVNFLGQPDHTFLQYAELTVNLVGGTLTSALAVLQLFANSSRASLSWAATALEVHGTAIGHVAAALALVQAMAALLSTLDTYGTSRPLAIVGNVMGVASGALLYVGWAATLEGFAVGASLTGIGLGLGLGAAALGAIVSVVGEDTTTKAFFVQFLANYGGSPTLRQLDLQLADSPDGQTIFTLAIREVRERAQRLTFPLAVWEERGNLERLGFSIEESGRLSAAQATYAVGPLDPAVSRQAFIQQVNATFQPAR